MSEMPVGESPTPESGSVLRSLGGRSLSLELTVSLILLLVLFDGVMFWAIFSVQERTRIQNLEALADSYSENLAQVLAVPIWDYDDEQIAIIGEGYITDPAVSEVRIVDAGGRMLFSSEERPRPAGTVFRHTRIVHNDQVVGHVDLRLSPESHISELAWLRNAIVLMLTASLTVIVLTTGLLLRVFMRRPLDILKTGIDRVARGEYDYGFEEVHHRELSDIAGRFRDMAVTVHERERSLKREIQQRRRVEKRIRVSEARSRALLDAIPDLVFRFDRKGRFLEFKGNPNDLLVEPDRFLGKNVQDILPADIAKVLIRHIEAAIEHRRIEVFEYQLRIRGRRRFFECRLVAVSHRQTVAIVRDITQQKVAAAERARLEEKLRRAQKMEAIGMLAGGVAHDLNNVLSGLVSYPQLLLMDLPEDSPLREPILTIQKSGEKAADIVQDLLTLARRGVAVREVVNLNDLIREFIESPEFAKHKAYHPGFALELELAPDLLNTSGSPVHLSTTIANLVSNAVEALPGKGRITIRTRNRYIDTPIKGYDVIVPGDYVVLSVVDDGIGIPPKAVNRIFEPFYTKKVMGRSGTGLGMAVVWSTVKDHKGYIDVQSEVGRGTRITVYLHASREAVDHQPTQDAIDSFMGRGETVLVVDDMPEQLEIASKMLQKLGYRVVTARSGEAAVAYLASRPADIVVLDMIMAPGMDGLDTYRKILSIRPGQKAVLASGFSETNRVHQAQTLGAGPYVKKPYLIEKIGMAVRTELDR